MAENNETPFSPLDSLGPEYGNINPPKLDELSYKPFEGDRIQMPEINFKASPVPNSDSLNIPHLNVHNTVTGIQPNKPGPKKGQSTKDIASALNDYSKAISQANQDKNAYSRIYAYNAGPSGNNFYKRYAAYGQEKFDEIGFSPLRDNESLFNERTTKWNDFTRMMQHSFLPLMWEGVKSGPKSLWKMAQGDFTSADLEDAETYENAAAIGQSTKGGVFGFVNNAAMNFGYTAGIITEILAEEGVALGITALTEGAAAPLLAGTTERNIARLGLAGARMTKYINKADDVFRGAVRSLEASDTARAFYRAANTKVGKVLNPFSNTLDAMNKVRQAGEFDNLTSLAKVSKTFGGFYRDVRNVNAALSEARLEAGMVENKVYQNLYDEHYRLNNAAPTNNQQYEMIKQAKQASLETLGWNTAIIYASNKITFDNILNPGGGFSKILGNKTKEILDAGGAGKVFLKKTYEAGSKIAKGEFEFIESGIKNSLKRMKDQGFKESFKELAGKGAKKSLTYFKGNISEGLQENAQETIAQAMEGYHTAAFDSKAVKAHLYSKGATGMAMRDRSSYFSEAWGDQNPLTAQGFETFATGFVMGAFAGPMNKLPGWASTGYNRIFKPEEYEKYQKAKIQYGKDVANTLTELYNNPKDFFDSKIFNLGNQEVMSRVKQYGGRKEALDASDQAFVSQVYTALKSGTLGDFKEHLASFKQLTPEEFEGSFKGVEKGKGSEYQSRIDGMLARANEIEKAYNKITERYPNPINLDQYEEGTDAYKKAAMFQGAWENAKMNAIFMNQSYENSIKRIEKIKSAVRANKPLSKMTDSEMQVLLQPERITNEKEILKAELESKKETATPDQISRMQTKINALEELEKAYDYYNKYEVIDREGRIEKLRADGVIKKTAEEQGISEEEAEANIRAFINNNLGVKERSAENSLEAESKLENAYKNYLKAIASSNNDTYLDENAEEAFEMLLDSYKLGKESSILASHINILRSPKSFIEHVEKNYEWMKNLYENRKDYFESLVNQELNNIELNALLNELADKNVYISADEAAEFQRTGKIPTEFFDNTRKAVIKPGHPEYNLYAEIFERAVKLRSFNPTARAADSEALALVLARLDYEMQVEIDKLPKTETTEELGKISLNNKESISIKELEDQLEIGDYVDAEYLTSKDKRKKVTFFKSKDGLRYKDADGDLVNTPKFKEKFVAGRRYKISLKPDAAEVSKIQKLFSEKKIEAINKLNERAKTEKLTLAARYIPFTTETDITEMPDDLRQELDKAFNNWVEDNDLSDEYEALESAELYERATNWIRTDKEAKIIIENYNQRKIDELIAQQLEDVEAPVMEINGETIEFENLSAAAIRSNIKKLERNLEKLNAISEEELTDEQKEEKAILEFNITLANKYLNYTLNIKDSPKRAKVLKQLKKLLEEQKDITRDDTVNKYVVRGNYLERVTKALQPFTKEYKYNRASDIEEVYNNTLGSGKSVDEFIKELKTKKLPGFSTWTYNELERELKILTGEVSAEEQPIADENLPEGFRYVEEDEILPAGDYITRISVDGKRTITNAPSRTTTPVSDKKADIEKRRQEELNKKSTQGKLKNSPLDDISYYENKVKEAKERLDRITKEEGEFVPGSDRELGSFQGMLYKAKKRVDAINAKYDAELAALEGTAQPKQTRKVPFNEVLTLVMEKTYEDRRIAGIYLDKQIRNFLAGVEVKPNPELISDEAYETLFGPNSTLANIKEKADLGEFVIIPNNIKLFDENSGIAGEIDLMIVDRNGKVFIIDIKTGAESKWENYNDPKSEYSKYDEYALQLTAYKNLLYNRYGIEASLAVLPLQIKTDPETGKTISIERASNVLDPDKDTFKVDSNSRPLDPNNKDQRTFQEKIDSIIPRISPKGEEITEEVPTTEEQKQIEKEVAQLTAEQKKSQDRNMLRIIDRIQLLRERQKTLDQDVANINDTLKFLDTILDSSIKLNMAEFRGLIENINNLDKVTAQLIKSKLTPKKGKRSLSAKELRAQLRREFAITGDVLTRVKDLKREKELLEAQVKDLKDQGDYYQNLLEDPNMTLFNRTEINNKISKVKRKISTIEKLIKAIQNAIAKSAAYIKEYLKIWDRTNTKLEKFKSETGYKPLASEDIKNLMNSVDTLDQATLAEYPNLTREFNKLERQLIDIMDATELVDDVKQQEETRLSELQSALEKYKKQLSYLNALLEPIDEEIIKNKISDKETPGPKPTNTKKASKENSNQTKEAVQRSKDDIVTSSFSLSDIADLGLAIEQEDTIRNEVKLLLDEIENAESQQDVINIVEDLTMFKASEVKIINDAAKEKIKILREDFKENVENNINTTTGAKYVTVKPIDDIPVGSEIVITKIDGSNITFEIVNTDKKDSVKTVKFDKLMDKIMTPEEAKTKTVETIEITPEAKEKIAESKTAADRLTDSEIDNIIGEVKSQNLEDLENNLYNLEIC